MVMGAAKPNQTPINSPYFEAPIRALRLSVHFKNPVYLG